MSKHALRSGSDRWSGRVTTEAAPGRTPPRHSANFANDSFRYSEAKSKRTYLNAARLHRLKLTLTERDKEIIRTLVVVRVATSAQLERLHFGDISSRHCRKALASLVDRRLLVRLPRAVGGLRAGSSGYVYALDVAGQRLAGIELSGRTVRPWPLGRSFLAHSLAVSELYVRLATASTGAAIRLVRFTGEPACWRRFFGPAGAAVRLKPDAYLVLEVDGYEDIWFVEVDLGTEALPTIARKCTVYRRYWQSGAEQERTGVFPKVLWLVPDTRRQDRLMAVVARQPANARSLFAVAEYEDALARLRQGAGS